MSRFVGVMDSASLTKEHIQSELLVGRRGDDHLSFQLVHGFCRSHQRASVESAKSAVILKPPWHLMWTAWKSPENGKIFSSF